METLGEACNGDTSFADSLEAFGGGQDDPVSVSIGVQNNYIEAEDAYHRALLIAPDNNKMCNLGICLMKQRRIAEAKETLRRVKPAAMDGPRGVDSHLKAYERAQQMLRDLESEMMNKSDHSTGTIGMDLITTGVSASERMRRENLLSATRNISMEKMQIGGASTRFLELLEELASIRASSGLSCCSGY
ncbi:unnamed protein product [Camellia sinensis]